MKGDIPLTLIPIALRGKSGYPEPHDSGNENSGSLQQSETLELQCSSEHSLTNQELHYQTG